MKRDPHNHKERYLAWIEKVQDRIPEISEDNSKIILRYILDMERGLNISKGTKKGARSYPRLNNIKQRVIFMTKELEKRFNLVDITKISEEQIFNFFNDMRNGTFRRKDGEIYLSIADYVKSFKAFWHWYIKISKKKGVEVIDITEDLDTSREKPKWVYLTEEEIRKLCSDAKFKYRVLITFLYDTGIRSPTELVNIRVSDFYADYKEVEIRDEVSKTFGRKIKLMLSSDLVKEYINTENLENDDYLFNIKPDSVNKYLQRLAKRVLGDKMSPAGKKYSELTMYHFRHCSCCYWLPRYKSESALKFRFGWKKSDKIHYYSEMLGMRDTIQEEDMLIDVTKTEIEKKLLVSENEKQIMQERMMAMEQQIFNITKLIQRAGVVRNELEIIEC